MYPTSHHNRSDETWVGDKKTTTKLQEHQRVMETKLLGITLRDTKTNRRIRQKSKVVNIILRISSWKWSWDGHVAKNHENGMEQFLDGDLLEKGEKSEDLNKNGKTI